MQVFFAIVFYMRKYVLNRYLSTSGDVKIIGHHGSIHMGIFVSSLLILILLWVIHSLLRYLIPTWNSIINVIIGWITLIIYIRFVIQFLNKYLDALVITSEGISVFEWEEFLSYRLQKFDWESIESITHLQHSLYDKVLWKWTIKITIDHWFVFTFHDIYQPHRIADMLREYKHSYGSHTAQKDNLIDSHGNESWEKFEILVETLWEVIKDYMDKSQDHKRNKRDL